MEATNLTPAPVWRRAAAMLYDSLLILALLFMAGFINLFIQIQIFGDEQLKTMTEEGYQLGGPFSTPPCWSSFTASLAFSGPGQDKPLACRPGE
ncbi:hypothetical protein [Endozoicomonas sp. GU-1]|uniref:hypothetical protein n=1 Tax=Endozoicomonas sp. GU-1 TaxID=3009078 RepID=UPI0022B48E30|nr:hypothetical protein [Endozoicomonas sp. GU-1]WBA86206.1 hypothetical protein O3276_23885 [Endozoicomonas sp. GU-1]